MEIISLILRNTIHCEGNSHVTRMGEIRGDARFWWGNLMAGPRCRWEDGIKIDLQRPGWGGLHWTDLAQDRDRW
jgi:hypothetical protein